jgi:tetratricopeptide (TPR) repeat protein
MRVQSSFVVALYQRRSRLQTKPKTLARQIGISEAHLHKIEAGERRPSPDVVLKWTEALQLTPEEWVPLYLSAGASGADIRAVARRLIDRAHLSAARSLLLAAVRQNRGAQKRHKGEIYHLLGNLHYHSGRMWRADVFYRAMEDAYGRHRKSHGYAIALYNHALVLTHRGYPVRALEHLGVALGIFQGIGDRPFQGRVEIVRGYLYLQFAMYDDALACYRSAARLLPDKSFKFEALLGIAASTWGLEGPENALPMVADLLSHADTPVQVRKVHHNLAVLHRQLGRIEEALVEAEAALPGDEPDALPSLTVATLAEKALCLALARRWDKSREALQAFSRIDARKDPQDVVAAGLLSVHLREPIPTDPLPTGWRDDYEKRVIATLGVLKQGQPPWRLEV